MAGATQSSRLKAEARQAVIEQAARESQLPKPDQEAGR